MEPLTAGIIPHQVDSPYSNMIIYDLAGHHQYFSCHSACLEAISLDSPAIFLLLQDLRKNPDVINKEVYYWSTMIDGVCHQCPQKSSVIVMGTHADLLTPEQLKENMSHLGLIARKVISHQKLVDVIAINLTKIYSGGMDQFRDLLYGTNKDVLCMSPPISMMCHLLLAFLKEKLPPDMHAISLSDLLVHLEAVLFIPALVSVDRPSSAKVLNNSFRWSEVVKSTNEFFTPRFHHVLLHRLPLEFALPAAQTTSLHSHPFNRRCDVWKWGLMWLSETGVTSMVEMSESFQSISLTMSSPNKTDPKNLELAHSVREVIKKTRQEFCPHLEVLEVVSCPPVDSSDPSNDIRVELHLLKKALLEKYSHIVDMNGKKSVALDEWKVLEPYLPYLVGGELLQRVCCKCN